ncbi:YlcI/YnfO family protein [Altericista sp. CCNU0014]|uniref:YlcI/YnfO family protein n=1 Tax=Altericista sp. CCNU0014 TaxID=3082949 RepID=UPI00384F533E
MQRESITIRFPSGLLARAKALKVDEESFNDLVVEALDHEVHRRQAIAAHDRIRSRRQAILQRTGVQPRSVAEIRELRSGEGRHA